MIEIEALSEMTDDQVKELIKGGAVIRHKTLKEYVELNGGKLVPSEEIDWGEPVGDEVW